MLGLPPTAGFLLEASGLGLLAPRFWSLLSGEEQDDQDQDEDDYRGDGDYKDHGDNERDPDINPEVRLRCWKFVVNWFSGEE